jgi:hypothetical protein
MSQLVFDWSGGRSMCVELLYRPNILLPAWLVGGTGGVSATTPASRRVLLAESARFREYLEGRQIRAYVLGAGAVEVRMARRERRGRPPCGPRLP